LIPAATAAISATTATAATAALRSIALVLFWCVFVFYFTSLLARLWDRSNEMEFMGGIDWNFFPNQLLNPDKIPRFRIITESVRNAVSASPSRPSNTVDVTFRFVW
jgi:hypothetical protein